MTISPPPDHRCSIETAAAAGAIPLRAVAAERPRSRRLRRLALLLAAAVVGCNAPPPPPPPPEQVAIPEPVGRSVLKPTALPPPAEPPAPSSAIVTHAGTGAVVEQRPPAAAGVATTDTGDGDVTLNFVDADVREVVRSVLGDLLHLNYVVDSKIQATITVQTSRPLRRQDVLPMLQQVLRASGLTLVESAGVYRVVPAEEAARSGGAAVSVAVGGGPRPQAVSPAYNVQVLPLRFAAAAELLRTVEPFLPKGVVLEADTARNVLILSGTGQDLSTVTDLVRTFDVDWLRGMSYSIIPLRTGSARALSEELGTLFGPGGSVPLAGVVRIAPLERMNAILVVTPQKSYLDEVRQWVERLDRGDEENGPQVFQYHVENSRAVDLARILNALISGRAGGAGPTTAPGTTPVEIGTPGGGTGFGGGGTGLGGGGTGLGGGGSSSSLGGSSLLGQQGSTPAPGGATSAATAGGAAGSTQPGANTPPLGAGLGQQFGGQGQRNENPEISGQAPGGAEPGTAGAATGPEFPQARVVADEKNNTLLIYAKPRVYRMIEEALKKVDVAPLQVLIEATIAEVTLTRDLQFGLQWLFKPGRDSVSFTNSATGAISSIFPGFNTVINGGRVNVILNALKAITDVKVISSPELLVLDRGVATLQVGDQVPILTAQVQSTVTNGAPVINSIDYRDTGVILRVSPRVNSNGQITLDVAQEVSDVTKTTSSGIDAPTFNRRRVESTVIVQDGETIALGGLIKDNKSLTRNAVPILGDIPVVGALFRSDDNNVTRTELLILLSPKVVHNAQEARDVTEELRRRLQGLQPLVGPTQ